MEEIARQSGVSKGLAYHYFDSKDELLAAALESRLTGLLRVMEEVEAEPAADRRLELLVDGLLAGVEREPAAFRLYLTLVLQRDPADAKPHLAPLSERLKHYLEGIRRIFQNLKSNQPEVDALLFRSTLLGLCVRLVSSEEPVTSDEIRCRILEIFDYDENDTGNEEKQS